ncbi:MAG: Uma2 family endonuclease [Dehalococcoidia bacterium]
MRGTKPAVRSSDATGVMPARRLFNVEEYERMGETGILHEEERVELLDGEILQMAAMGSRHAGCVEFLVEWFIARLAGRVIVRVQNPVRLRPRSQPEPDLALLRPRADRYRSAHPGPEDVYLIIEVAESSLAYDRDRKLPRYAKAGIPEVWIVDLIGERVSLYRAPHADRYQQISVAERGGTLTPEAFPELSLPVAELLG